MGHGSTQLVAYVASGVSIAAILACVVFVPMLWSKLGSMDAELRRDMMQFKVRFQINQINRIDHINRSFAVDVGRGAQRHHHGLDAVVAPRQASGERAVPVRRAAALPRRPRRTPRIARYCS